jgi:hypothetical protein
LPFVYSGPTPTPSSTDLGALIQYGNTFLGVNAAGHLNYTVDGYIYGVFRSGLGDAISPGCQCEGWGVAASTSADLSNMQSSWASLDNGGIGGLQATGTFGATASTATSTVFSSTMPLTIRQAYGPSMASDLFQVQVTLTNTSASDTLYGLTYRRTMDWDVPPTEFNEYVTHSGVTANLVSNGGNIAYASNNGFSNSNPLVPAGDIPTNVNTVNTDFTNAGPADHGSVFDFTFSPLAAGASRIFNIFYGSAANEVDAKAKLTAVGANVYSLGKSSLTPEDTAAGTPGTFIFGFGGVGGIEPGQSPDVPVLPFVEAPGQYVFDVPTPRRWFDPPTAEGFTYSLTAGTFKSFTVDPGLATGDVELYIDGVKVDDLAAGESFDFIAHGFTSVTVFTLKGLKVDLGAADAATAFPTFLDFTDGATGLRMSAITSVPEPESWAMVIGGMAVLGAWARRQRKAAH